MGIFYTLYIFNFLNNFFFQCRPKLRFFSLIFKSSRQNFFVEVAIFLLHYFVKKSGNKVRPFPYDSSDKLWNNSVCKEAYFVKVYKSSKFQQYFSKLFHIFKTWLSFIRLLCYILISHINLYVPDKTFCNSCLF